MGFLSGLRVALISTVNVKFLRFTYALTLALLVGILTLLGIAGITYKLVTTCETVCSSTPLALIASKTVSKLSCVGFKTRALQLSISPNEQSRALFTDVLNTPGNPGNVWTAFSWSSSSALLGKCSYLHATECGLREWLATFQGMVAISSVANDSKAITAAAWPEVSAFYSSGGLDEHYNQVMTAAQGTTRITAAGVHTIINGAGLTPNTTVLEAPPTAACCDISLDDTKLGVFGGGSSRFVVNIKGKTPATIKLSSCSSADSTGRCSWVDVNAALVLPPRDQTNQRLCGEYWEQQTGAFKAPASMSASMCQTLGQAESTGGPPASHSICLNGTMNNVQVTLQDYYTITGSCPNMTLPTATATATPKPWTAQQLAATTLLLPLAHEFGMAISAYMVGAQVDIAAAAQGLSAVKNDNEAASWWMENYLYCCSESCKDWLSSIGSALGYETYIEGGIALLVIALYLTLFGKERQRLDLSAKVIYDIAFQSVAAPAEAAEATGTTSADSHNDHAKGKSTTCSKVVVKKGEVGSRAEAALPGGRSSVAQISAWQDE